MYFVDSHIHFSDSAYQGFQEILVNMMRNLNIQIYSMSVDLHTSIDTIKIKKNYFVDSDLYKTFVGIHPEKVNFNLIDPFTEFFFTNIDNIDGIGEIGLDPTYTLYNKSNTHQVQALIFNEMLNLAEKTNKPVSIHSRRSLKEILEVLPSYKIKGLVFHWYDGSKKLLKKINDMGYYVSFGPYLLYSKDKQVLLSETDTSLLLLETDGPVSYKYCFEGVLTSSCIIISLINFVTIKLKKNFNEMSQLIYENSVKFMNSGSR